MFFLMLVLFWPAVGFVVPDSPAVEVACSLPYSLREEAEKHSLEILEQDGETWVNVTGLADLEAVFRVLPSTVTNRNVVREIVEDEEGEVSEWLIFSDGHLPQGV